MSCNDGNIPEEGNYEDDGFSTISDNSTEFLQALSQPTTNNSEHINVQPTHMWQNQLMGSQCIQQNLPTNQTQQQQYYNDYMYNMHTQNSYTTNAVQPETYSVLPVGHGNFLKVYHCPENTVNGGVVNDGSMFSHQMHQPQAFHMPTQTSTQAAPQIFNSYELFSSNNVMPLSENHTINTNADVNMQQQHYQQQCHQPSLFMFDNCGMHDEQLGATNNSTANMIINKLVNNWSPILTGGAYNQYGTPMPQMSLQTPINNNTNNELQSQPNNFLEPINNSQVTTNLQTNIQPQLSINNDCSASISANAAVQQTTHQLQPAAVVAPTQSYVDEQILAAQQQKEAISTTTTSHIPTAAPSVVSILSTEVKKRIVAEVKPMRLTYSDVLSKTSGQQGNSSKSLHSKQLTTKNRRSLLRSRSGNYNKRHGYFEDGNKATKKPTIYENKENLQQPDIDEKIPKKTNKIINKPQINDVEPQKYIQKQKPIQKEVTATATETGKKRSNNKRNKTDETTESTQMGKSGITIKDMNSFYNITLKEKSNSTSSGSRTSSASASSASSTISNDYTIKRKTRKANKSSTFNSNSHTYTSSVSYKRFNHATPYSYSKRNRGSNSYMSTHGAMSRKPNPNYELAKKILRTWFECMVKVLTWLYNLVYDIVVIGFSVFCERMSTAFESLMIFAKQLRKDLKKNSNKPSIWLKNCWQQFDALFEKDSYWSFWRRFYKKKPPDPLPEPFRSGRIPQTGEEAMYSLLNCKGKDAYSILGLTADSPQEQIRKHYKKIAVLVHPDKNKQAGAEEAFKVLHRAFELIGEPESRTTYDLNLVETLHAEKSWTELHDLLSQLHSKIAEAANTISRCSTCGLRHPRKQIDRPHYAARDCASCKIRHSSKEGDIWAETSFFGLRWKYLALMEGKVYDITEWANCQKGALSHLEPNSHMVQYRIVRGVEQQTQHSTHGTGKRENPQSDTSLHDFLDNLYSGQNPNQPSTATYTSSSKRRSRRY